MENKRNFIHIYDIIRVDINKKVRANKRGSFTVDDYINQNPDIFKDSELTRYQVEYILLSFGLKNNAGCRLRLEYRKTTDPGILSTAKIRTNNIQEVKREVNG